MRKSLWIIFTVLFLAVIAPNARADSSTVTFTTDGCTGMCLLPNATDVTFPSPTTMDVTFDEVEEVVTIPAGVDPGEMIFWSALDAVGFPPVMDFDLSTTGPESCQGFEFPVAVASCGTVTFSPDVSTAPEPSSVPLMLVGTAFVIVTRKRWAKGLRQPA